jgi:predicted outer membrane lipoprotein
MRNDRRDDDLFDETRLRRALRLDATELPPRIDIAAITAQAEAHGPALAFAGLASTVLAGAAVAALAGLVAVAVPAIAPTVASDLFDAAIRTLARAAVPASELLAAAQQPSIPLAATFALVVAVGYEYVQRRERLRAITS